MTMLRMAMKVTLIVEVAAIAVLTTALAMATVIAQADSAEVDFALLVSGGMLSLSTVKGTALVVDA